MEGKGEHAITPIEIMMFFLLLVALCALANAFSPLGASALTTRRMYMGLDPVLTKSFPRDFKSIPFGTDYGDKNDEILNKQVEDRKLKYLEEDLFAVLKAAAASKERPMFTTALIAGDAVILDALAKTNLLSKVPVVFVDTFTLFPESIAHLKEVENHYGFKSQIYHAQGCKDQEDYYTKYGRDYWMKVLPHDISIFFYSYVFYFRILINMITFAK